MLKNEIISRENRVTERYSHFFKNRLFKQAIIENDITMQGIIKVYKDFLL